MHEPREGRDADEEQPASSRRSDPREAPDGGPPPLEWAFAGLGLLLVAGSIGLLVADALRTRTDVPDPVVRIGETTPVDGGYALRVDVRNRSGAAAARLKVRLALRQGASIVEERELEFDYLPGESVRQGGVFFRADPRAHRVEATPLGYGEP